MNPKLLSNVNRFGKIGKMIMTLLLVVAIIITLLLATATIYVSTLPKDAVKVTITNHAEFKINKNIFSSVWSMLTDGFSYASNEAPSGIADESDGKILPPENTEINTELNFFDQSYASERLRSEGNKKIIEAISEPSEYHSSDLMSLLIFATLLAASAAVTLFMLRKLFQVLCTCESPFCTDFVTKLRGFGYTLLPVTLFASIGETLAIRFLSAGEKTGISVQWGLLVAFAVTMCLVTVFRYGVQLQKESDETL